MEQTIYDPVLGRCTVIPLRRKRAVMVALMMAGFAVAGLVILGFALLVPDSHISPFWFLCAIGLEFGWLALPKQIWAAKAPYYAIVGETGFTAFRANPILWKDVVGLQPRFYRGKAIALGVVLNRPVKRTLGAQLDTLFGLLNFMSPANVFFLPRDLTDMPLEQIAAMFALHIRALETASAQPLPQ